MKNEEQISYENQTMASVMNSLQDKYSDLIKTNGQLLRTNIELQQQIFNKTIEYEGAVAVNDRLEKLNTNAINQYSKVVEQNKSLQADLLQMKNEIIGKDAKIASMRQGCPPSIVESACSIVYSIHCAFKEMEQEGFKGKSFKFTEDLMEEIEKTGKMFVDFQNGGDLWTK